MAKKNVYTVDQWMEVLKQNLGSNYQLALHQIGIFNKEKSASAVRKNNIFSRFRKVTHKDVAKNILQEGLINTNADISLTVSSFGTVDEIEKSSEIKKEFLNYEYFAPHLKQQNEFYDIIIAIPEQVNVNGDDYYLGHMKHSFNSTNKDPSLAIRNRVFGKDNIPAEFIYGYIRKFDGKIEFNPNEKFIGTKSKIEQDAFYEILIGEGKLSKIEPDETIELPDNPLGNYKKFLIKELQSQIFMLKDPKNANLNKYNSLKSEITKIKEAEDFKSLGVDNIDSAMKTLLTNNINPNFESYEQAFTMAPITCGSDISFLKDAIAHNANYIVFDRTNDEQLYIQFLESKIEEAKKKKDDDLSEYDILTHRRYIDNLKQCKEELLNPKEVAEGKYKVPHRFMFEEFRNSIINNSNLSFWYLSVDGVYDEEFGKELETLYDDPDILLGIHGLNDNPEIEAAIFKQGLKNSTQDADNTLTRTVAFGKDLTFVKALNYRIPYNGLEPASSIILTLPSEVLDPLDPLPIWGSHDRGGSYNYILPEYVYGIYHARQDKENRKIIKNNIPLPDREVYEYLKYDKESINGDVAIENPEFEINSKTL